MKCPENKDDLLLLALDALEGDERASLEAHLATGCPSCQGEYAEARAAAAQIPLSLPDTQPPVSIRERLLKRVEHENRGIVVVKRPWMPMAAAAAIAAVLISSLFMFGIRNLEEKNRQLADQNEQLAKISEFVQTPGIEKVQLKGTNAQPQAEGYLLIDRANSKWMLVGTNLQSMGCERAYELWFLTADNKKIPGGVLTPDGRGRAVMVVNVPSGSKVNGAALTDEPPKGVDAPTGNIQAAAKIN